MRWLARAAVQGTLSVLPRGHQLNYLMQRHVSRRLPARGAQFDLHVKAASSHLDALETARPDLKRSEIACYEFGAGWDLIGPITMWALGVEHQTILDIRPHVKLLLVNDTISKFAHDIEHFESVVGAGLRRVDPAPLTDLAELDRRFGIRYLAPADARSVPLPDGSIDFVSSTFTLEHIPADEILAILIETRRLLAEGGVISSQIDMQDHYHYIENDVSVFNFLKFSPRVWRMLNPGLQWQSRLRHSQYLRLFSEAGYELVSDHPERPSEAELAELRTMKLAAQFRRFDPNDLGTRATHLVVRKPLRADTHAAAVTSA